MEDNLTYPVRAQIIEYNIIALDDANSYYFRTGFRLKI